jgi:hypothetical protein
MCLAPKMPKAPEAPAPPPQAPYAAPETAKPVTVKPSKTKRESMQQASKGTAALTIPLSTGGMSAAAPNLTIGGQ